MNNLEELINLINNETNWSAKLEDSGTLYIQQYSPLGEDMFIEVCNTRSISNVINEIKREYKFYDIDEHAMLWINGRGQNGVPNSISALVKDAEDIEDMLEELYHAISKFEKELKERAKPYEIDEYTTFEGIADTSDYFTYYTIDNKYKCVRYLENIDTYDEDIDELLVYEKLESFKEEDDKKPLINNCGKILRQVYKDVYFSDSGMCFIDDYKNEYTPEELDEFDKELEKYGINGEVEYLNDSITVYPALLEVFKWDFRKEL